jgi:hypothetical protein
MIDFPPLGSFANLSALAVLFALLSSSAAIFCRAFE